MPLSPHKKADKKAQAYRRKRRELVVEHSITGSTLSPYMEANWDAAARQYITDGTISHYLPEPLHSAAVALAAKHAPEPAATQDAPAEATS